MRQRHRYTLVTLLHHPDGWHIRRDDVTLLPHGSIPNLVVSDILAEAFRPFGKTPTAEDRLWTPDELDDLLRKPSAQRHIPTGHYSAYLLLPQGEALTTELESALFKTIAQAFHDDHDKQGDIIRKARQRQQYIEALRESFREFTKRRMT